MKHSGILLLIFIILISAGLKATQVTDSLENLLQTARDTNRVKILCDLCWEYRFISVEKSLASGEEALALSFELGYDKGIAQSYNDMGIIYIDQSQYSIAIEYFQQSMKIRQKLGDQSGMASLFNKIGIVYQKQGKLKPALENQIEALKIYEDLQQDRWIAYSLNNIAIIHQNLGNLEKSLQYHQQALDQRIKIKDIYGEAMSYGNIANAYLKLEDTLPAISYYNKALGIFRTLDNKEAISVQLSNLGNIYLARGRNKEALEVLLESLSIREKIGDKKGISSSLIKMGEAFTNLRDFGKASKALYRGLGLAIEVSVVEEEMSASLAIAKMYALQHKLDSAFLYTGRYISLKDSVYNERLKQQIIDVQVKYEAEKLEQDNELLLSRNKLNKAQLRQQTTEIWLLIFVIISIFGAGVFLYYRHRQRQRAALNAVLIQHNEMRVKAVFDGQEEERRRIARELHDGVGQKLAGVKLNWQAYLQKQGNNTISNQLDEMTGLIDKAASEVRTISHQMMPKELEQFGLVPAVESMLDESLKNTGIDHSFEHFGLKDRLPAMIELHVFRILQELTSNVIKHAEAHTLHVQLLHRNQHLVILVEDDGKGFDTEKNKEGIGIMNIESRAENIDGVLDIESQHGKGTTFRIRISLNG